MAEIVVSAVITVLCEKLKDHFEVRAWVCVSEECHVFNISKAIFQAVTGQNKDFANLDLLHVALREELSKKRFLLVLDDVWNEDDSKWELLQSPLHVGAPGSRVYCHNQEYQGCIGDGLTRNLPFECFVKRRCSIIICSTRVR
ncbi:unnamed protein product [Lactuca virosa]|uniref:NB-ARC domain-containing protein n=1 Tax=Lactuca virosa TaxID=75947 RepID=A0AAU9NS66_9ASTR|nr:unnamed protein product [Lactuca virosa]